MMGLIREGIDCVRVFELPAGVWADGRVVSGTRICLVRWRSTWADKVHQVYAGGRLAAATVDSQQRQIVVQTPSCNERAVRVEVFAVEQDEADFNFSDELEGGEGDSGRAKISLLRSQRLPAEARFKVYYDNGTGEIDYTNPIGEGRVWTCRQDKAGFGLAAFGEGDFGYDWAGGIGFGMGSFGLGEFGVNADTIEWLSPALEAGVYRFAIKVIDEKGNISAASETGEVVVIPAARPASAMRISSFDDQTSQLTLEIEQEQ